MDSIFEIDLDLFFLRAQPPRAQAQVGGQDKLSSAQSKTKNIQLEKGCLWIGIYWRFWGESKPNP